jgi:uncharacterized membrane protein
VGTTRIEAFSDGVIAIIVTIMVLELRPPRATSWSALLQTAPGLVSYLLSFLVVAVMWVNHHHLIDALHGVTARVLWLNLNLLFWMSLIPFVTAWMGQNYTARVPVAVYGLNLSMCSTAFGLLRNELLRQDRHIPTLAAHHRRIQQKTIVTALVYAASAVAAQLSVYAAEAMFALIPFLYFLPERAGAREEAA